MESDEKRIGLGIGLLLPGLIAFVALVWLPLLATMGLSFINWDILSPIKFAGVKNFTTLLGFHLEAGKMIANDPQFWYYLWNTFYTGLGKGLIIFFIPLFIALLARRMGQKSQSRLLFWYIIPVALLVSPVTVCLIWRWMCNPDFGLVNGFIAQLGNFLHLPLEGPDWVSSKIWAKPAMILMGWVQYLPLWIFTGLIFYLAAWRDQEKRSSRPVIAMLAIIIFISCLGGFTSSNIMTGGGPAGATTTVFYYIFSNAYQWFKMGYASAVATLVIIFLFILGIVVWRIVEKNSLRIIVSNREKEESGGSPFLIPLTAIIVLAAIIPFAWGFATSLKEPGDVFTFPPEWIPTKTAARIGNDWYEAQRINQASGEFLVRVTAQGEYKGKELWLDKQDVKKRISPVWKNYAEAWKGRVPMGKFYINSIIRTIIICLIQVLLAYLMAYSISILKVPGRKMVWFLIVSTMLIKPEIMRISLFVLTRQLNLVDTHIAIIFPFLAWGGGVFLFKLWFDGLCPQIEEAREKGEKMSIFRASSPMIFFVFTISFFLTWTEYHWPLIMINSMEKKTLSVGLAAFQALYTTDWTLLMAGGLLATVPAAVFLFLILCLQRNFLTRMVIKAGR